MTPLLLLASCTTPDLAQAQPVGLAAAAAPAAEQSAPEAASPPAAPEYRVSKGDREVYRSPVKGGRLRGRIPGGEPFAVVARVGGPGCAGDGWARVEADGYVCLEATTVTADAPVVLPRLVPFDPPLPDEYYSYVETGLYEPAPLDQAPALLPFIYGKAWRRWKGNIYASPEAFERGAASIGKIETGLVRKSHFVREIETSKGPVVERETGGVVPVDDVFLYAVSRHHGRDLVADPVPDGMIPGWTVDYEGAEVHATPDPASPIAVLLPHHRPVLLDATPADPTGHWWRIPDLLGPGRDGFVDDIDGVRHPTFLARPVEVGAAEQWADVDIAQQVFMLYQGDRLVFTTLVATGEVGFGTPKGLYRIQKKSISADMSSRADAAEPYYVEDVPWTMHFWPRYALHGVFWHWGFGRIASHGCVNLSPLDAKEMFARLDPKVPAGWSEIVPTEADPGTTLRVRSGAVTGPDKRNVAL
jgi:hypothetical protein